MQQYILFYVVFASQILLISYYYPRKMHSRMKYVLDTYPPTTYPKLYPNSIDRYERGLRNYRNVNFVILSAGIMILAALIANPPENDVHNAIAIGYFMAQMFPLVLLDIGALKSFKLMRNAETRTTRKADLQRRRFFDFVSPVLFSIAAGLYIAFVIFIFYVNQFGFEWFGGYMNIVGITVGNASFAGLFLWHMYGKKLDPYQSYEDRATLIKTIAKTLLTTSIVVTLFITLTISLSFFEVRHLLPIFLSLYFQMLAIIGLQAYQIKHTNFEVYKEDPVAT